MKYIKIMAVVLLTIFSITTFASVEKPKSAKLIYYYTTSSCVPTYTSAAGYTYMYYTRTVTTYSVNEWGQIEVVGVSSTTSNTPCMPGYE